MRLANVLGGLGKLLIWVGAIILAFVAFQLWGTNVLEARAQDELEDDFATVLDEAAAPTAETTTPAAPTTSGAPTSTGPTTTGPTTTGPTTIAPDAEPLVVEEGEPIARIEIPAIGVDKIVVEGVRRGDLQKGPGHYPETPMPGQAGNAAIAGHRTTYGAPFNRVAELEDGDEIVVTTVQGTFTYAVIGTRIVAPTDVEVLADEEDDRLTLTSCHPEYSARERIIISAELVDDPAPTTVRSTRASEGAEAVDEAGATGVDHLDGEETGPIEPVIVLGLVALAVWLAFFVLSRRWRRWPAYLLGVVPFGIALFVWFGAVAALLPSNF